jgi:hypothetical protein
MFLTVPIEPFAYRLGQVTAAANQIVSTSHYQAAIDFADRVSLNEFTDLVELAIEPSPIDLCSPAHGSIVSLCYETKLAWRQHVRAFQSGFDLDHGKVRPVPKRVTVTFLWIESEFLRSIRRHRLRVPPNEITMFAAESEMAS